MVIPEHHGALVDHLVQATEPVQRIWPVRIRFAIALAIGVTLVVTIGSTWPRPDLAAKLREPFFVAGLAALASASALAALMALRSAVPGRAPTRAEAVLAAVLVITAAVTLSARTADAPAIATGWSCALRTLALAAGPWVALLVAIRRGAPVRVRTAAAYISAAALLFSTTVLRFGCPDDRALHWLGWHLGVVLAVTLLTLPLAATWLRTWRHR